MRAKVKEEFLNDYPKGLNSYTSYNCEPHGLHENLMKVWVEENGIKWLYVDRSHLEIRER